MKKTAFFIAALIYLQATSLLALTPSTGDKVLDKRLDAVNAYAAKNPDSFVTNISKTYNVDRTKVQGMLDSGMTPADVYMTLRISKLTGQPPEQVEKGFLSNPGKGWGVLAKSLGIKPGSADFKSLKDGTADVTGGAKGKSGSKGSGKGSGKSGGSDHGNGGGGSHGNGGGKGKS